METTATTYEFWSLDGRHLDTITTADPLSEIGYLAQRHGVDADEITWEEQHVTDNYL